MRWALGDIYPACESYESDLGNVDLPRTMLQPDSALVTRTPSPKNIVDHEGRSL